MVLPGTPRASQEGMPQRVEPAEPSPPRTSLHVDPVGIPATARHYIRDLVYGANDGIITTFAVVSGATGGSLSYAAVLIIGVANLAADGMSMGIGNLQAIRAHERVRAAQSLPEEEAYPWKHGTATLLAFVGAGAVPLLPFLFPGEFATHVLWSAALTFGALFGVGAARAMLTGERWWRAGAETLFLGGLVAMAAYGASALIASVIR
jgi:VIT1/CCC1 family predicted Fe2+/Mn2+ transporter